MVENSRNGPFGPKNDRKTQIWPFLRSFLGSKFGTIPSGGGQNSMHHSFGGGPEFGTIPSGGGQNLEPFLRGGARIPLARYQYIEARYPYVEAKYHYFEARYPYFEAR